MLVHGRARQRVGQSGRVVELPVLALLQQLARAVAQELVKANLEGFREGLTYVVSGSIF